VAAEDQRPPDGQPPNWTESDKVALDALIQERQHRKWLFALLKNAAQWIAAIGLGGTVLWDWVVKIIKQAGSP
jgi:hypothetical protein